MQSNLESLNLLLFFSVSKEKRALTDIAIESCQSIRKSGRLPAACTLEVPTQDADSMVKMKRLQDMIAALLAESQAQDISTQLSAQEKAFQNDRSLSP